MSELTPPGLTGTALPFWKAALLGFGAMSLGLTLGLGPAYVSTFAGHGALLAQLMGMLVMLPVCYAITVFAARFVATGSLMSYIYEVFGPVARAFVGASLLIGYFVIAPSATTATQIYAISVFEAIGTDVTGGAAQALLAAAIIICAATVTCLGAEASARVSGAIGFLCVPPIIIVMIGAAMKSGLEVNMQFDLASFDHSELLRGAQVGMLFFVGFEGLSTFAAETTKPRRNIPRLLYTLLLGTGGVALFAALLQTPILMERASDMAEGASPIAVLSEAAGWPNITIWLDLLIVPAGFVAVMVVFNFAARVIATAARDGLLPAYLGQLEERNAAPRRAAIFLGLTTFVFLAIPPIFSQLTPVELGSYYGSSAVFFWLLPYALICIGAAVLLAQSNGRAVFGMVWSTIGAALMLLLVADSFLWPGDGFLGYLPYVMLAVTVPLTMIFFRASVQKEG
jgi:amino acid transporter